MSIPKWCDKKSVRSVTKGKGSLLFCCRKGHWKKRGWGIGKASPLLDYRCEGGMALIEKRPAKLIKGAKKEKREHPWASSRTAKRIASDHLARNPKAYGAVGAKGKPKPLHPEGEIRYVARAGFPKATIGMPVVIEEARYMGKGNGYRYRGAGLWFHEDDLSTTQDYW